MTDKIDHHDVTRAALRRTTLRLLATAAIAAPIALSAQVAAAQDAAAPADVQEVIVTGSRVARTGFTTPTPTTVVNQQLIQQNAAASVAASLQTLPAFRADQSPATAGPRAENTPGAAYANLRGLGSVRTLTLVNGQRVVPTNPLGNFDLNLIPSLMIDRVDVVTGGASAAYGSDAVSGVVNVVLNKTLQGFKGDISYGQSSHDDNVERRVALAGGTAFADGRGHVVIAGEYSKNAGIGLMYNRDWGREAWGVLPNPAVTASNPKSPSNPANLVVPFYQPSNLYVGGLIPSGALRGTTLEAGGVLGSFDYGNIVGPSFMSGGSNYYVQYYNTNLNPPSTRKNLMAHVDFDVTDNLNLFADAAYASSHSVNRGGTPRDTGTLTIRTDNPFMPTALLSRMQAAGLTSAPYGRYHFDLGASVNDGKVENKRLSIGGEGKFGDNWSWDAYASYGKTHYVQWTRNARVNARFFNAIDAVRNAAGATVCRVNADAVTTNDDPACVPANIFGVGTISAAARDYINEDEYYENNYTQKVIAANLRGSPFATWAGDVSIAVGGEHRREKSTGEADALSLARAFYVGNQQPINGEMKVTEGYIEAVTPLATDQPWAKNLEIDTAVRRTHYSTAGSVTTWKAGLNWEVNDMIRVRATRSRDIRAPNINELFTPGGSTITGVVNPARPGSAPLVPQIVGGNPGLKFEVANTTTAGIVFRPSFVPGLDISIDYYKIDLKNTIGAPSAQQIADGCFAGNEEFCSLITLTGGTTLATGTITSIFRPNINIATAVTKGWDFEVRYRVPLDNFDVPGDLTLALYSTYMQKLEADDTGVLKQYAGEVGTQQTFGGPKWRATFLANYTNGPLSLTGQVRYVGGGKYRNDWGPADIDDNTVSHATYVNLGADYTVIDNEDGTKVVVYGLVQNLFSKDPPIAPTIAWPTNPQYYDMIGRTWKTGVRFEF